MPNPAVPIGPTTVAGYGATIVGLIATILATMLDVDQQQAAVIAGAVFTVVSFGVTQIGRYAQARELAKRPAAADLLLEPIDDGLDQPEERDLHDRGIT